MQGQTKTERKSKKTNLLPCAGSNKERKSKQDVHSRWRESSCVSLQHRAVSQIHMQAYTHAGVSNAYFGGSSFCQSDMAISTITQKA